jgi:hypothetical protein
MYDFTTGGETMRKHKSAFFRKTTNTTTLLAWLGIVIWALSGCAKEAPVEAEANSSRDETPKVPSAAEVVKRPEALQELKEDLNLTMKKKEVQTAIEVASISRPQSHQIAPATFDTLWKSIPMAERQSKSVDELKEMIMARHQE